jgi:hypothetical protein
MFIGLSLIALALGYRIFMDATRENTARYRNLGRVLGLYIMLIAFTSSGVSLLKYCNYFTDGKLASKICFFKK